jgi:hypothetical protein
MNQTNQPLGQRLRHAAIDRTIVDAERVDNFVIDAHGVIDLRELDKLPPGASIADPAKALRSLRGQLGDAAEVSNLYDESELPKPRWRRGRRARRTITSVPTSTEMAPPLVDLTIIDDEPTIQLDEIAQTVECPQCATLSQRDLFDQFSQVEFFSCNSCMHMWQKNGC